MIGAIIGDIIGSRFERFTYRSTNGKPPDNFELFTDKCHFTDDSVLTIAIADSILTNSEYAQSVKSYGRKYPNAGYGGNFKKWLSKDTFEPYNSWGNGSAMRVSPVAYAFNSTAEVLEEAMKTAVISHNHPEGVKGAQAIALAIFLARTGQTKLAIKKAIVDLFQYDLDRTIDEIRPTYSFDVSCQGSVPEAIIAFLEGKDFEDTIRKAISLGGDTDTIACMAGSIAEAFYQEIPKWIILEAKKYLNEDLLNVLEAFQQKYNAQNIDNKPLDALLGVIVGDAVGVPYEFLSRKTMDQNPATDMIGFGTYELPKGTWSDDSSLTLCLAESLNEGYNLEDMARKFIAWKNKNYWTPRGEVFDIGNYGQKGIPEDWIVNLARLEDIKNLTK